MREMKRFIGGFVLGALLFGALPVAAEFGWTDTQKLADIIQELKLINVKLQILIDKGK